MQRIKINDIFDGMRDNLSTISSTKTVVGEPIQVGGTTLIPLSDVSMGMVSTVGNLANSDKAKAGMGAKLEPSAVIIIENGYSKVVPVKSDTFLRLFDMMPDVVARIKGLLVTDSKEATDLAFPEKRDENK